MAGQWAGQFVVIHWPYTDQLRTTSLHPNQPHPVYDCLDLDQAQKVIAGELPQHLPLDPSAG